MDQIGKINFSISYENDIRKITVNNSTRIYQFIKKCLDIFDISISNISGIYFFFIDANVYLGDSDENDLNKTIGDLIEEYDVFNNRIFIIEPLRLSNRESNRIEEFKIKYQFYANDTSSNYYFRPNITINNNYNNSRSQDGSISDLLGSYLRENNREIHSPQNYSTRYSYTSPSPPEPIRPTENNQRQTSFQSPVSILQTMLSTFPVNETQTYVSNGVGSYVSFLNSLSNLINQNGQSVLTTEQVNNLSRGTYRNLRNEGVILPECTSCHITLEEFSDNTQVIALPCRHAFQENAITYWLTHNSNRCPVCRMEVNNS